MLRDSIPVGPLSKSVSVLLLIMWGCRGTHQILTFWAKPSLKDCFLRHDYFCCSSVVDVDLFIIADCDIACLGKFISAQEVLVGEGKDHVHCSCWLPHGMVEFHLYGARGFVDV